MSPGVVFIRQLEIEAIIGVHDWERRVPQVLLADLEFELDFAAAAASDALQDTLDYGAVAACIRSVLEEGRFQLLERAACAAADALVQRFGLGWLRLQLAKPGAVAGARDVGVLVERGRPAA